MRKNVETSAVEMGRAGLVQDAYSVSTRVIAAIGGTLIALMVVSWWWQDSMAGLKVLPWSLLAALLAYSTLWKPKVRLGDGQVAIVNPFRTIRIPVQCIDTIHTALALRIDTTQGSFTSWGVAGRGRPRSIMATHMEHMISGASAKPQAAAPGLAEWVRDYLLGMMDAQQKQEKSTPATVSTTPTVVLSWDWLLLSSCAVLAVIGLVTSLV